MAVSAIWFFRKDQPSLKPWVNAVLLLYIGFFMSLLLFAENPFDRLWRCRRPDGRRRCSSLRAQPPSCRPTARA